MTTSAPDALAPASPLDAPTAPAATGDPDDTSTDHPADPVTLRIVVAGAAGAGKSTTARALGDRLGQPVVSPDEGDGRTVLFDWLEYIGGRHDGRAIRTQLVTAPGSRPDHMELLLGTAHVVVVVADTTAAGLPASATAFADVLAALDGIGHRPGILVQANKRDRADAVALADVRLALGLDASDPVIETVATDGDGVRQGFVYAVREGLKQLGVGGIPPGPLHGDAEGLAAHLRSSGAAAPTEADLRPRRREHLRAVEPDDDTGPVLANGPVVPPKRPEPAVGLAHLPPPPSSRPAAASPRPEKPRRWSRKRSG